VGAWEELLFITGYLQFNILVGIYFPLVYLLLVKIKTEQFTDVMPAVLVQTLHVYPSDYPAVCMRVWLTYIILSQGAGHPAQDEKR
jgi:hypothetical protein